VHGLRPPPARTTRGRATRLFARDL
jgi:hypothetical protein